MFNAVTNNSKNQKERVDYKFNRAKQYFVSSPNEAGLCFQVFVPVQFSESQTILSATLIGNVIAKRLVPNHEVQNLGEFLLLLPWTFLNVLSSRPLSIRREHWSLSNKTEEFVFQTEFVNQSPRSSLFQVQTDVILYWTVHGATFRAFHLIQPSSTLV